MKKSSAEDLKVMTNNDGLRERFNYPVKKPADTFRIITLGNSFTFGLYIQLQNVYAKVLENKLNALKCVYPKKFEVINLATPGYDIAYSEERFKRQGLKYQPDMIIFLTIEHDFKTIQELQLEKLENYKGVDKDKAYFEAKNEFQTMYAKISQEKGKDYVFNYQMNFMEELVNSVNKRFVIGFLPYSPNQKQDVSAALKKFAERHTNVSFQDIPPLHSTEIYPDSHPNQLGHKVIAKELFTYLRQQDLIPCQKPL